MKNEHNCDHCGGDLRIRNPKGYCDHLYYPQYCNGKCKKVVKKKESKREFDLLRLMLRTVKNMQFEPTKRYGDKQFEYSRGHNSALRMVETQLKMIIGFYEKSL